MATAKTSEEVLRYLEEHEKKDILRFVAVGSVDDGKSTLIGRLLHDSHGIYDDQLRAVTRASKTGKNVGAGGEIDFSLFTDGLKAEREQGITIDVAYRYFATAKRKFIIADTPGHVQYTRNMATGASTADVAIILIDARLGVLAQSRRHAFIASLLGIPHLVVGVNKMDLVGYDPAVFDAIAREFSAFAENLGFRGLRYVPISALRGDNVVHRSERTAFYDGPTLLEVLETIPIDRDVTADPLRFPVQTVLRPNLDYRGFAGQIASGIVKVGDAVMALPSRKTSRIVAIDRAPSTLDEAFAPMSVTLRLADEIDVSRGDLLVHEQGKDPPRVVEQFDAMMVWMNEKPLDREKSYLLKHTTQTVRAEVDEIAFVVDLETLAQMKRDTLVLNDIGRVSVRAHKPLFVDPYTANRATGAFILIDSLTNDTVAAGMIVDGRPARAGDSARAERTQVSASERRARVGHGAAAIVAADKATAFAIERQLFDRGCIAAVVEGKTAVAAAIGCVSAGLIAVVVGDREAGDAARALEASLGEGRVVDVARVEPDAAAADPRRAASDFAALAIRALEQRGIV